MNRVKHTVNRLRESQIHRLIGGDLSLDFANTINGHSQVDGHEYLHEYRDVVLWSVHAEILDAAEAGRLLDEAASQPSTADEVYRKAIALRGGIFRTFSAIADGVGPTDDDIELLTSEWRHGQGHLKLVSSPNGYALGWDDEPALEAPLRKICAAAIALLTSDDATRISQCDGEKCDWLFVNRSRNHLRRWCSMDVCGNRAKMRRRQARKKLRHPKGSQAKL